MFLKRKVPVPVGVPVRRKRPKRKPVVHPYAPQTKKKPAVKRKPPVEKGKASK